MRFRLEFTYLFKIDQALIRIKNKTYGIDFITGELIPKSRLIDNKCLVATTTITTKLDLKK